MHQKIEVLIKNFVWNYKKENNIETNWGVPLVAYSSATDPLYIELKTHVSRTHKLPEEILSGAKTIISYFVPFEKKEVLSNIKTKLSSRAWAIAYVETNRLIHDLNEYILFKLKELHYQSVNMAPTHNFDESRLISDWSHKHVAYIAGLGKFGLHKMLITEKGCCGRLGSLITTAEIKATKRPNHEFCLYYTNKNCQKCVEKCVNQSLRLDSFDRHKCYEKCLENSKIYDYLGLADVCGKCIANIPCSFAKPVK